MPNAFTSNYNLVKPEEGGDRDAWGHDWNINADTIDGLIKSLNDAHDAFVTAQATKDAAQDLAISKVAGVPIGTILLWPFASMKNGVAGANLPAGFMLCNGTTRARSDGLGTITAPEFTNRWPLGADGDPGVANRASISATTGQYYQSMSVLFLMKY